MHWKKITAAADAQSLETLEALLWNLGSVSVTVTDSEDNPIYEPGPGETPLWSKLDVTGLFEDDTDQQQVLDQLSAAGFKVLFTEELGDRPWEREWLARFHAKKFGKHLWICPIGEEVNEPGAVVLHLDPGLAFGTGGHATTQLCLEWLDFANVKGKKIIDYGSGSGILGIAALLLGAQEVLSVDNDPQALRATRDNAERNNVGDRLTTAEPGRYESVQADVVIANILAQPLIDLSDCLLALLKTGGELLLSGIMESQQGWVEKAYQGKVTFIKRDLHDGWLCLQARK